VGTPEERGVTGFFVVVGQDFAGKSSALARLRADPARWQVISTDSGFLDARHGLVSTLRRGVGDLLPGLGSAYTPEFLTAVLQTAVVHLRDELARADPDRPVVVDSYYYKIIAKCQLAGVADNPMFDWWRSFPQPRRVVRLDVSAESAWRRCGAGARLNSLEYYGTAPTRDGFERYQRDLVKLMRQEIEGLPETVIDERPTPAQTARAIREVLDHELS
jgi:thymidylate kinase